MSAVPQTKPAFPIQNPNAFFIGGKWEKPQRHGKLSVISPVTEEVVQTFPEAQPRDVDRAVAAAREAFDNGPWPRMSAKERGAALLKVAEQLQARLPELATTWTDAGRRGDQPHALSLGSAAGASSSTTASSSNRIRSSTSASAGTASACASSRSRLASSPRSRRGTRRSCCSATRWRRASRRAARSSRSLRPRRRSTRTSSPSASRPPGLPPGVFNLVPAGRETGDYLIRHPGIDKISFTGSTAAG